MSFHNPTRLELAMHEAGHAYAFASLVRFEDPWELGLGEDECGNFHGWCRRETLLHREVSRARVSADAWPAIEWQAAAEVIIAIAGPVAEFRHRHRSRFAAAFILLDNVDRFLKPEAFDVDGDLQRIRDTLNYIQPVDAVAAFRHLIDVSDRVISDNWPSVRRLGRHLFDKGRLGEDDLAEWFLLHPAKRHSAILKIIPAFERSVIGNRGSDPPLIDPNKEMHMKPSDATDELHRHNTSIPTHRLAELFSVIDGSLWSPDDEAGLKSRLADYMEKNGVSAKAKSDEDHVASHREA